MPRALLNLSTTPFGTGRQTVGSAGAEIWDETLAKEAMHQQKDFQKQYGHTMPHMAGAQTARFSLENSPTMLPLTAEGANTKIPLQIRDPSFIVPGDPRLRPKVYLGHKQSPLFRGQETCAPHTPSKPLHIPGLNKGLGGYRSLTARQQFQLQQYPPPFPTAQKSQATPGTTLPGSTTYGFGYNFDLARRCSNYNVTPYQKQYRPGELNGEMLSFVSGRQKNPIPRAMNPIPTKKLGHF